MTNTTADPFANIPNSDDSLNGEFSPAAPAASCICVIYNGDDRDCQLHGTSADDATTKAATETAPKYGILERTEHARQYLAAASIMGLPLPTYVHIGAHDHGDYQSSNIGIQLANASQVKEWAVRFAAVLRGYPVSVMLETGLHSVQAYGREADETPEVPGLAEHTQAAPSKPIPPQPPMTDNMAGGYLNALRKHTQAACDTITKAAQ